MLIYYMCDIVHCFHAVAVHGATLPITLRVSCVYGCTTYLSMSQCHSGW